MIYKYVKCESVIAKIMADSDASGVRNRISDIREWIFEAIEKIGAPMQYIRKESGVDEPLLKLIDYQVPIPDDLIHLDTVAYSNTPMAHGYLQERIHLIYISSSMIVYINLNTCIFHMTMQTRQFLIRYELLLNIRLLHISS